jgi:hypothetical protein
VLTSDTQLFCILLMCVQQCCLFYIDKDADDLLDYVSFHYFQLSSKGYQNHWIQKLCLLELYCW